MALKKRGNTYHADFVMDGQRYRQSLETSDWRKAQALHAMNSSRARKPVRSRLKNMRSLSSPSAMLPSGFWKTGCRISPSVVSRLNASELNRSMTASATWR
jgi:hypothetical protein